MGTYAKAEEIKMMLHGLFDSRKKGTRIWQRTIGAVRLVVTSFSIELGADDVSSVRLKKPCIAAHTMTVSI